jgi:hypothetical protein
MVVEGHAVWASGNKDTKAMWVELFQVGDDRIQLVTRSMDNPMMTVEQARYLASKLNRLASKIEERNA